MLEVLKKITASSHSSCGFLCLLFPHWLLSFVFYFIEENVTIPKNCTKRPRMKNSINSASNLKEILFNGLKVDEDTLESSCLELSA